MLVNNYIFLKSNLRFLFLITQELIYFIGLELIDDANQFVNTDSSIIESRKLLNSWVISLLISNINLSIKLHPWIPTEFSNFHFPFFQSYTSNLIAQWQSKLGKYLHIEQMNIKTLFSKKRYKFF